MELEHHHLLIIAAVGVVSGTLNVLAGGGSLLVMPLFLELGLTGPVANGTARLGVITQSSAAMLRFFRGGFRPDKTTLFLVLATLPGAASGAFIGTRLKGPNFRYVLAAVMFTVGAWMFISWLRKRKKPASDAPKDAEAVRIPWWGYLLVVGVGFYGGFIQAGVGFLVMAVLHQALGIDLVRVNAFKVWMVFGYTLIAIGVFVSQGAVEPIAGAALAVGTGIGGWIGARLSITRGEGLIRVIFTLALVALIARLVFFS